MARGVAILAAITVSFLAVAGAGGAGAQTPKRGGTVVIAAHTEPACLNLFVTACNAPDLGLVLGGAFDVTPEATFKPDLVSSAHVVLKHPFTLLYRIRPEARWSDGVPVTTSDFEFTQQALRKYRPDLGPGNADNVRSVLRLDAKTFKVVLREPDQDWRYLFPTVLPSHALAGMDLENVWRDAVDDPKTGRRIGNGPFLFGDWERGKELTLVRNPRYWGPHTAYLDQLLYRFLPSQDLAEAMRRGEIDMIDPVAAERESVVELRRQHAPGIRVLAVPGSGYENIAVRLRPPGHPALRNPLVRRALAYGIDRVAIARTIGTPLENARPTEPFDSVVFPTLSPYYRPKWKGYRYRPAQARRLLEQAGCRRGQDRIYSCDGERLELRFLAPSDVEFRRRTVELVAAQLRQVGVEIRPEYTPPPILFGPILENGDFDLMLFGYGLGASTSGPLTLFGCQQDQNISGYCDRLVTRDLVRATRIIDLSRRVALLNRIDARLATAVPALPLYPFTSVIAFRTIVRGVVPNGVGSLAWNAENWWLAR